MAKMVLPIEASQLGLVYEGYVTKRTVGRIDLPFIFAYEASKYGKHFSNPAQIGNPNAECRPYSEGMTEALQNFSKRLDSCRRNPSTIQEVVNQMLIDVKKKRLSNEVYQEYIRQYGAVANISA